MTELHAGAQPIIDVEVFEAALEARQAVDAADVEVPVTTVVRNARDPDNLAGDGDHALGDRRQRASFEAEMRERAAPRAR